MTAYRAYEPLNVPKRWADDIWTVDGPEIAMRYLGIALPFPTRMTIVRLPDGRLWLHSPIAHDAALEEAIGALGEVAFLVAPSTLHYWYMPEWHARFPGALSFAPKALRAKARRPIRIDRFLTDEPPEEWQGAIDQCLVEGRLLTEVDFHHRASHTLILTDLIENFEPDHVRRRWLRWAMKIFGAAAPDGKAPIDMQLSFIGHRRALRAAVGRMIDWAPERIVIAHGRCYERGGVAELKRAFRWIV